eukprot:GHUV01044616.1.p1 GENE.GHUV01044616.1~~GHUV01044616.1.p1  ORF type:complete len:180 (+),score=31.33 GHUV01044616.1:1821-2360(+)
MRNCQADSCQQSHGALVVCHLCPEAHIALSDKQRRTTSIQLTVPHLLFLHTLQQLQTPASHRFFDIRIQSSWGTGASSSQAGEASVTSRWWNGGRDSDSPILQDPTTNSSSAPAQGRFANLFSNKDAGTHDGSSSLVSGGSSYIPGSIGSIGQHGTAADNAAPWVLVALVPTMVWCVTW